MGGIITSIRAYKLENDWLINTAKSTLQSVVRTWVISKSGVIKCNFDAAFNWNSFISSLRIIFKNKDT